MTLRYFFIFLLLISCLQPWRLAASTPGAEDFLKYVTEEGTCLVDEVIGEEGASNNQFPLNTARTAPHAIEERASLETSSSDAHSIIDVTSSSSSIETEELPLGKEQMVSFLDDDNIKNLEKANDAVIKLSEQRNRCLASAATATVAKSVKIVEKFQTAARTAEQAIASYSQFAQKMKEGDVSAASQFRIQGFSLECKAMMDEYDAQCPANKKGGKKAKHFSYAFNAVGSLKHVVQAKSEGQDEIATVYEQAAQYYFQAAQASIDKDNIKAENFLVRANYTEYRAASLYNAAQAGSNGQDEVAKACEQVAQYYFQAVQAVANEDKTKEDGFVAAVSKALEGVESLKKATQAKSDGKNEVAKAHEQVAHYYFQAAQAVANGDSRVNQFYFNAAVRAGDGVVWFEKAAQARNTENIEFAKRYEQVAEYHLQAAKAAANGDNTQAENFSNAASKVCEATGSFYKAVKERSEGNVEGSKMHEQAAQYFLQAADAAANGDSTKASNFCMAARNTIHTEIPRKKAVESKNEGEVEAAEAYEQAVQYFFQAAQSYLNGDKTKALTFFNAACKITDAALPIQILAEARKEGNVEIANVYEQAVQHHFQAVQAALNGDNTMENFSKAASAVLKALEPLQMARQARNEGKMEIAKGHEQAVQYCIQAACAVANGDDTKVASFATRARHATRTAEFIEAAVQARNKGQLEVAKACEQAVQYRLEADQADADGDSTTADKLFRVANCIFNAAEGLKELIQRKGPIEIAQLRGGEILYYFRQAEVYMQEGKEKGDAFSREVYNNELKQKEEKESSK